MITYRLSPWPIWSFHTVSAWTLSASFGGICLHVQHVDLEPLWARLASNRAGQQVAANWSGTTELHWNWKAPKENDQIVDLEQIIWVWPCVCVTLFVGILCRIYYRWSKCNLFLAAAIYWFLGWKGHLSGHGVVSFVSQWLEKRTWVKALVSASFDKPVDGVIRSKVQICGWSCYTKNCPNLWKSLFETSWNDPLQVFQDGDRLA